MLALPAGWPSRSEYRPTLINSLPVGSVRDIGANLSDGRVARGSWKGENLIEGRASLLMLPGAATPGSVAERDRVITDAAAAGAWGEPAVAMALTADSEAAAALLALAVGAETEGCRSERYAAWSEDTAALGAVVVVEGAAESPVGVSPAAKDPGCCAMLSLEADWDEFAGVVVSGWKTAGTRNRRGSTAEAVAATDGDGDGAAEADCVWRSGYVSAERTRPLFDVEGEEGVGKFELPLLPLLATMPLFPPLVFTAPAELCSRFRMWLCV